VAKVVGPLHSSEARGRMAGLIFNTWRGIAYVKAFCAPAQPRSTIQLQIRAWTTMLVRYWQSLSDTYRAQWNDYAVTHPDTDWSGNPKRLTGANWFVRCSLHLLQQGIALVETAPIVPAPDAPTDFAAANGILQSIITWTATAGTNMAIDIYHLGPISQGIAPKITRARHLAYEDGETATFTATGLVVGRHWFWARIVSEDDGLASTWVCDYADITAE